MKQRIFPFVMAILIWGMICLFFYAEKAAQNVVAHFQSGDRLVLIFENKVTDEKKLQIEERLQKYSPIQKKWITQKESLEDFKNFFFGNLKDENVLSDVSDSFPEFLEFTIPMGERKLAEAELTKDGYHLQTAFEWSWLLEQAPWLKYIPGIVLLFCFVLAMLLILVFSFILQQKLLSEKIEWEVRDLLGSSSMQIFKPILRHGITYAVITAAVSFFVLSMVLLLIQKATQQWIDPITAEILPEIHWQQSIGLILIALFVGALSSWQAYGSFRRSL